MGMKTSHRHLLILILPVMMAMLVSGCTLPGGGSGLAGKGIIIESFEPDFPQIYSTESVQLSLKVKNMGTVDGIITDVQLTGIDWESGGTAGLGRGTCEGIKGKMLPAVPEKGITGETKTCFWVAKPRQNEMPEGLSVTFYPVARVTYGYTTTTMKSITLGTSSELRSIQDRGGTLPADTISTTSGPVAIDIISKSPIRVSEAGVEFPVEIRITNAGDGIVCKGSCTSADYNKLNLEVKTGQGITPVDGSCANGEYTLWRGKENTLLCKFRAEQGSVYGAVQKMITAKATYGYITDKPASVTVTGQNPGGVWA